MTLPVRGADCVLRISAGVGDQLQLVEGLRLSSWAIFLAEVDVTTVADAGWSRLLSGAGLLSVEVRLAGLYLGSPGEILLRDAAFRGAVFSGVLTLGNDETMSGDFIATSLSFESPVNEETAYVAVLRSSGPITIG